ncbi:PAP/fibrillin family protein [Cyanobacterium stanieri LEGE 03274]|uniref:PAP/fibrillin family protein n=1 Tax=Cyanobacterium stanieri LEGE 03274 TaxID=1828756 RepID=A0ABR9V3L8_9CHRO|nr:PAP/fibrillin family protein [Cyanobacterium stanieri]MBE9222493.1 PAP/fibrillin family protein [Cyanobacterium stanieri LEGE 03274]
MNAKINLLGAIARYNGKKKSSDSDKVEILSAIEELEDTNPNPRPMEKKELLNGDWQLLYTSSKSLLGLNNLPLVEVENIYQSIHISTKKIYNIVEIKGLPLLDSVMVVIASLKVESEKKVNVKFERTIVTLKNWLKYLSPEDIIRQVTNKKQMFPLDIKINQALENFTNTDGWLETTYLDDDLRISRGNQGNIFVLSKI